jgi:hypothetical protein
MPKDNVGKKIDALADLMRELLSREVAPIAPIAPVLPVAPIAPVLSTSTDDHIVISNLALSLGNLDTKVTEKFLDIKNDIKGLSDGTASIVESTTTAAAGSMVSATYVANTTGQLFVSDFTAFKVQQADALFFAGD